MLSTVAKMRIAHLLYSALRALRRPFGGHDRVTVKREGLVWNLDLREGIDLTIYAVGAFERDTLRVLRRLVKDGSSVLDIGANVGAHTLHLARLVGSQGRVLAFEPTDYAITKLRANLESNPELSRRVDVHQAFLAGETAGAPVTGLGSSWPVDGSVPDDAQMGSRTMAATNASTVRLDDVLAAAGSPAIQLVKMDVDGHETEVLEGATELLERCKPVIVMELAPYVFHPPEKFDRMIRILTDAGYVFRTINFKTLLPSDPSALRAFIPREGSVNVVALAQAHGS